MRCGTCGAAMVSRVTERFPNGDAQAGIICCSVNPWHVHGDINRVAWAEKIAKIAHG